MRAVVLDQAGVRVQKIRPPEPGERALVRVAQAGLCGTDLKIAAGEIPVARPRVLGHEMTGWLDRAGARGLLPAGTPVLVNPAVFCGHCELCRRDLPQLCTDGGLLGRDADGVFADLVAVDDACLHPLPAGLPSDGAALLQVLSTCVHAQSLLTVQPGDSAVVVGLGAAGLLHVQLLRDRGVAVIVGVTRSAAKRELARRFGASEAVGPEDAAEAVAVQTCGRGADLAIEAAGSQQTLVQAMRLAAPGGTVLVYGTTVPAADGLPTYDWVPQGAHHPEYQGRPAPGLRSGHPAVRRPPGGPGPAGHRPLPGRAGRAGTGRVRPAGAAQGGPRRGRPALVTGTDLAPGMSQTRAVLSIPGLAAGHCKLCGLSAQRRSSSVRQSKRLIIAVSPVQVRPPLPS
jgi:threonine dehydrogenase-like Zn-dependent dehydrogenase